MMRILSWLVVAVCAVSSAAAQGGDTAGLIHSYELIPANPAPNTPFELNIVHDGELLLDSSDTTVVIDGNRVEVVLDFFYVICPPLIPCEPLHAHVAIPGLPSGAYHMHFVDSDGDPPFDASIDFVVGGVSATSVPMLSAVMKWGLGLLLMLFGIVAAVIVNRNVCTHRR